MWQQIALKKNYPTHLNVIVKKLKIIQKTILRKFPQSFQYNNRKFSISKLKIQLNKILRAQFDQE